MPLFSRTSAARTGLALISTAALVTAMVAWPVSGQESILPSDFGAPPKPEPKPQPTATPPKPAEGSGTRPDPSPASPSSDGGSSSSSSGSSGPSSSGSTGSTGSSAASTSIKPAEPVDTDGDGVPDEPFAGGIRYDLPPGSRRSLDAVGILSGLDGGMGETAFGSAGGTYLATLMNKTRAPLVSRWAHIIVRRALLSEVATPDTINGADFVAARAGLLLRLGEANAARSMVQAVDHDRFTPRLLATALDTYVAAADPAGLCPLTARGTGDGKDGRWQLASAMCAAMSGEASSAGATVGRVRTRKTAEPFDILLAEKVLGASANGRRAVTLEWDEVKSLSPWGFGIATATGSDIPGPLRAGMSPAMQGWAATAPMMALAQRVEAARGAAASGVLSNAGYMSLLSAAAADPDVPQPVAELATEAAAAFTAPTVEGRVTAMGRVWSDALAKGYGGLVLTARAAAALPVSNAVGDRQADVIASMLSGGFDTAAADWLPLSPEGSASWAQLAVALPTAPSGIDAGAVDDVASNDDSADKARTALLAAGLAGLGRLSAEDIKTVDEDYELKLSRQTAWTKAIQRAASRGERGTVALLVAVGLQGSSWDKVPALHLYHVTRALVAVGMDAEARMIAAEAVARA